MTCKTLTKPMRTMEEALAASLQAAKKRLPLNQPCAHIDDARQGVCLAVFIEDGQVMVRVMIQGAVITEAAGYWAWAIA